MKITLVRSANGPQGTAFDPASRTRVREGQTVDVSADVAARLQSTAVLGDVWEVQAEPEVAPAVENAPPPPAAVEAVVPEPAPVAQEVSS